MNYELADLIDLENSQRLLDSFCDVVGIAAGIIDLEGEVLVGSRWQRICTDFHRVNKKTYERCIESDTQLANELEQGKPFSIYQCRNGLTDAASPIIIEGEHMANIFVGQFLLKEPDQGFFRRQAATYGFQETDYLNALRAVPIVNEEKLSAILRFLTSFAETVAKMGLDRVKQIKAKEAIRESEERFKAQYQGSPIPTFTWQKREDDFVLIDSNEAAEAITNGRVKEFIGKKAKELYGKRQYILQDFQRCFVEKEKITKEVGSEDFLPGRSIFVTLAFVPPDLVMVHLEDISERKQAEEKLRKSEAQHRLIAEHIDDIVWQLSMDMRFTVVSQAVEDILGYSVDEALQLHVEDLLDPDGIEQMHRVVRSKLIDRGHNAQKPVCYAVKHKKGHRVELEVVSSPIFDTAGNPIGFVGVSRDRTKWKKVEDSLRQSEEKYRSLFEMESDAILLIDDETLEILDANAAALMLYQYSKEELLARKILDLSAEPDKTLQSIRQSTARIPLRWHVRKDGTRVPVEISRSLFVWQGRKVRVAAMRDISSRLEAERQEQETQKFLMSILDNIPALVYVNTIDNRYCLVNKAWEKFMGKTLEEVEGRSFEDLFSPGIARELRTVNQEVVERGTVVTVEQSVVRPQGRVFFQTVKFPLRDAAGRIDGVGGISIDMTERKLADEALRKTQEQLLQAQKMESLGTLVAGVAHEINNPVNLIMLNVPLIQKIWKDLQPLLEEKASEEPERKYGGLTYDFLKENLMPLFSDMDMASHRIAKIVIDLKNFARRSDATEKAPMQINSAIENALRLSQHTMKKSGVDVEVQVAPGLPLIKGNLQTIEQVVLNLLLNASQSIDHDHGKITVTSGFQKATGRVFVSVSDNGRGIDPSVAKRIFDPFVTTRQTSGGTGLGLSISYSIVKAHDGDITFKSDMGKGTTFTVTFPTAPKTKRARILVADDEESSRDFIVYALERDPGFSVEQASTGSEALLKIETFRPDLVLLDVFMPDTDGLEVCRALKKDPRLSGIKVIIITGHAGDPKLDQIKSLGFEQIFEKPMRMGDLLNQARKMLEESAEKIGGEG